MNKIYCSNCGKTVNPDFDKRIAQAKLKELDKLKKEINDVKVNYLMKEDLLVRIENREKELKRGGGGE